jgi:C4-dicarboxylate-specific signal transduction histidine kinase
MSAFGIHFRSLTAKLLAIYVPLVCVAVLAVFSILEFQYYRNQRAALVDSLDRLVALQGSALSAAAWEYDTGRISALLAEMRHLPQLQSAVVFDEAGRVIGQVGDINAKPESPDFRRNEQLVFRTGKISENVGRLVVTFQSGEIWKNVRWHLWMNGLILMVMAATLVAVTLVTARVVIGRPLRRLLYSIDRMKTDHAHELVEWKSADELGRVVDAYNEMQTERAEAEARRRRVEEEARDRMAELAHMNRRAAAGELSASIAHEISQPLAAIVAGANAALRWLARKTPDLEEATAALKQIVSDGHRAGEVIATVRAMYRKNAQDRALHDINEIVAEVLGLLRAELQRHQISVRTALTEGLPLVRIDQVQLQQVILNLAMNSVEAMEVVSNRSRVLSIRSEVNDTGDVLLTIEDSGSGINPEDLDRIFQPFFTTKLKGMGMGLSICRSIVEGHGGHLWASSGNSYGTAVQLVLPAGQ